MRTWSWLVYGCSVWQLGCRRCAPTAAVQRYVWELGEVMCVHEAAMLAVREGKSGEHA